MPALSAHASGRPWPSCRLRGAWLALLRLLQLVCHRALALTLGASEAGPPPTPPPGSRPRRGRGDDSRETPSVGPGASSECSEEPRGGADDFSVSYALRYPNDSPDPALEAKDLTVGEHVDPSLFVAEPCCGVEGLEIRDRESGRWVARARARAPARESSLWSAGDLMTRRSRRAVRPRHR